MTPIRDYEIEPKQQTHYIIVAENRFDNLIDLLSGLAIIGLGVLLGIQVVQWFGLAIGVIMVLTRIFQPDDVHRADNIEDAYRILDMLDEDAQEGGL